MGPAAHPSLIDKINPVIEEWAPVVVIFIVGVILVAITYMIRNWFIGYRLKQGKRIDEWQVLEFDGRILLLVNIAGQCSYFMEFEDYEQNKHLFKEGRVSILHSELTRKTITNKGPWVHSAG